jgi:propionate CoA-transferase
VVGGTLTAGDLDIGGEDGRTVIRKEGRHRKFVPKLEQVCYSAAIGRSRGQVALFVTERAVFRIGGDGLELVEVAPGIDVERDVIAQMGFRPRVAANLATMDARIFAPGLMGLAAVVNARPRQYRSARVARWHAAREAGAR